MKLDILTPEKNIFSGEVDSVTLPGTMGMFMVLPQHAPMISSLRPNGLLSFVQNGKITSFTITGGFVEVLENTVTVCADGHVEVTPTTEVPLREADL